MHIKVKQCQYCPMHIGRCEYLTFLRRSARGPLPGKTVSFSCDIYRQMYLGGDVVKVQVAALPLADETIAKLQDAGFHWIEGIIANEVARADDPDYPYAEFNPPPEGYPAGMLANGGYARPYVSPGGAYLMIHDNDLLEDEMNTEERPPVSRSPYTIAARARVFTLVEQYPWVGRVPWPPTSIYAEANHA